MRKRKLGREPLEMRAKGSAKRSPESMYVHVCMYACMYISMQKEESKNGVAKTKNRRAGRRKGQKITLVGTKLSSSPGLGVKFGS